MATLTPGGLGGPGGLAGNGRPALSLADLEAADPRPAGQGDERRFCCPLPACAEKPRDRAHQSLCVNVASGLWLCNRCGARGKLTDRWQASPGYRREAALRAFRLPPDPQRGAADSAPDLARLWAATAPLPGTPGARYLEARRGIPLAVAEACGVRYARDWYGAPAVVFPCHDRAGGLVAANGRYLAPRAGQPKTRTCGDLKLGAFAAPGAWAHDPLVLVEGPVDALALCAAGLPAVALVETRPPVWLTERTFGRRVAVALDADAGGDAGAAALVARLAELGALPVRWRPPAGPGVKDWGDLAAPARGGPAALLPVLAALRRGPGPAGASGAAASAGVPRCEYVGERSPGRPDPVPRRLRAFVPTRRPVGGRSPLRQRGPGVTR
jgi:Toprim-like